MMITVDPLEGLSDRGKGELFSQAWHVASIFERAMRGSLDGAGQVFKAMKETKGFGYYQRHNDEAGVWREVLEDGTLRPRDTEAPNLSPLVLCQFPESETECLIYDDGVPLVRDSQHTYYARMYK